MKSKYSELAGKTLKVNENKASSGSNFELVGFGAAGPAAMVKRTAHFKFTMVLEIG
jgi:hypothetical protein